MSCDPAEACSVSRFYSIAGLAPSQRQERRPGTFNPQRVIESELGQRQLGEFLESRKHSTSHLEVGLSAGDKIHFRDAAGDDRPAIVEGEERDQHSGKVDVWLRANDPGGSGTYKVSFEGDTARSMKSSRVRRVHE